MTISSPTAGSFASTSLPSHAGIPRLVLAHYFTWYDITSWDACNISAGDRPSAPYNSDDPQVITGHVEMAIGTGIDGFLAHWFAPGDRTDHNFATLLSVSANRPFFSTIVFSRHIWHGSPRPTQERVIEALRYIMDTYSGHPQFLRVADRPVLFFTDMGRVPKSTGQTAQTAWAAIRAQVDPTGSTWWIAEGLDPSHLQTFDGLYVFKITHAAYPNDYLKAPRWAARVREWEKRTGQIKLWLATISPGWDDTRANCRPDVRSPSPPHLRPRENGIFYRSTFDAAIASNPDWLLISSFNEWVEGTYIEPSTLYGHTYLDLTQKLITRWKVE